MTRKTFLAAAAAAFLTSVPLIHAAPAQQMKNNCEPGDRIDATTPAQAKQKLESAGYAQIHDLRKGCDNYWHAQAMKDGAPAYVALSPDGRALPEND